MRESGCFLWSDHRAVAFRRPLILNPQPNFGLLGFRVVLGFHRHETSLFLLGKQPSVTTKGAMMIGIEDGENSEKKNQLQ